MELWEKIRARSLGSSNRWSSWISCLSLCDSGCTGHFVCSNATMEDGWKRNLCFPTRFKKKKKKKKNHQSVMPCVSRFVVVTNWNANKRPSGERCEVTESLLWCCLLACDRNCKSAKRWRGEENENCRKGFLALKHSVVERHLKQNPKL